ncbi:MAG: acetyl-CoA carboxylase, carboxyltransferase subunit beta, partial [Bacteroidia bacterium]
MGWFKRLKEGITTSTKEKKETPEGLWYKCPSCKKINTAQEHANNKYVCIECGHHERIGSAEYFEILFDNN